MKAASGWDIKVHLFPVKFYKRADLIWEALMFIAYWNCFWKQFKKKKIIEGSVLKPDAVSVQNHPWLSTFFYFMWCFCFAKKSHFQLKQLCSLSLDNSIYFLNFYFSHSFLTYVNTQKPFWTKMAAGFKRPRIIPQLICDNMLNFQGFC